MQSYGLCDTRGRNSTGSVCIHTTGPLEPDFWQPIDCEGEQWRPDDASEPYTPNLDGTSSMHLADLYTWLDNALESRPEDPGQPAAGDSVPMSRQSDPPTVSGSPRHMAAPFTGEALLPICR